MKKVKIGVFGIHRGGNMIKYCAKADNTEIVAICVKAITALCGYSDAMYFSKVFRMKMDMPPDIYPNMGTLSRDQPYITPILHS